jgi:hypothetical protein
MGGVCSTHVGDQKCIEYFCYKTLMKKDHSEDLGMDGK